jgi:uncharacterized protein
MPTIKEQILEDMKTAMRSHDKESLSAIRLIMAALKQREVDERIVLSDEQIMATLNKMIKQRRDSISQFASRPDLAAKEAKEIEIIQHYLPAQLSEAEIERIVISTIKECGATSAKEMGKVMAVLKTNLQGKAEMTVVSAKVKQHLGS